MPFNLLLVDDNLDLMESMALLLEGENINIACASNLSSAHNHLKSKEFDLVYLDIRLPDGNGLDLYRELKLRKPNQQVIMMTGFRMEQVISEATEDGFRVLRRHDYTEDLPRHMAAMQDRQVLLFLDRHDELDRVVESVRQDYGRKVLCIDKFDSLASPTVAEADMIVVSSRESLMHGFSLLLGLRAAGYRQAACLYIDLPEVPDARRQRSVDYLGCIMKPFDPAQVLEDLYARVQLAMIKESGEAVA